MKDNFRKKVEVKSGGAKEPIKINEKDFKEPVKEEDKKGDKK